MEYKEIERLKEKFDIGFNLEIKEIKRLKEILFREPEKIKNQVNYFPSGLDCIERGLVINKII